VSTDVENDIQLEMPMDHIMMPFVEAQPEAWKQAHLVCRDDRSTAVSWPSKRQHSPRWCRMWRPTPVSRLKPSEITMLPPSDGALTRG